LPRRLGQPEALRYFGAWLDEMSQQYCSVVKALGEDVQVAVSKK